MGPPWARGGRPGATESGGRPILVGRGRVSTGLFRSLAKEIQMGIKEKLKDAINKGQERARQASRKSGKHAADQPRSSAEKLDEEMRRRRGEPPSGR